MPKENSYEMCRQKYFKKYSKLYEGIIHKQISKCQELDLWAELKKYAIISITIWYAIPYCYAL